MTTLRKVIGALFFLTAIRIAARPVVSLYDFAAAVFLCSSAVIWYEDSLNLGKASFTPPAGDEKEKG